MFLDLFQKVEFVAELGMDFDMSQQFFVKYGVFPCKINSYTTVSCCQRSDPGHNKHCSVFVVVL